MSKCSPPSSIIGDCGPHWISKKSSSIRYSLSTTRYCMSCAAGCLSFLLFCRQAISYAAGCLSFLLFCRLFLNSVLNLETSKSIRAWFRRIEVKNRGYHIGVEGAVVIKERFRKVGDNRAVMSSILNFYTSKSSSYLTNWILMHQY